MHIDKFRHPNGHYVGTDDCFYDSPEEFIQVHELGFCGCGDPEENLAYVRRVLRHIADRRVVGDGTFDEIHKSWVDWDAEGDAIMGPAKLFTQYVLAQKDLTEHGGSVGGAWLSNKGYELLEDLDELYIDENNEQTEP